jgi:hypothetical protein
MWNIKIQGQDNFSHWLVIVRQLFREHRLPNYQDADIIHFQAYLPGGALFIYFIMFFTGFSEGNALIAQMFWMLSLASARFVFAPRPQQAQNKAAPVYLGGWENNKYIVLIYKIISYAILLGGVVWLLSPVSPYVLLVDSLLACAGAAGLAVIAAYRKNIVRASACALLISISCILIKNAGIFFVAVHFITLVIIWLSNVRSHNEFAISSAKHRSNFVKFLFVLSTLALPLIFFYLWLRHVDLTFTSGIVSDHSMSLEYLRAMFDFKSHADKLQIARFYFKLTFFNEKFIISSNFFKHILLCNAVVLVGFFLLRKKADRIFSRGLKLLAAADITYVLYCLGVLAMYLFSMDMDNAPVASEYDRYNSIGYSFVIVALIIAIFTLLPKLKFRNAIGVALCGSLVLGAGINLNQKHLRSVFVPYAYAGSMRESLERAIDLDDPDASVLVYSSSNVWYRDYMIKYLLDYRDRNSFIHPPQTEESLLEALRFYNYFVIAEEDDFIRSFMRSYVVEPEDGSVGTYSIVDMLEN